MPGYLLLVGNGSSTVVDQEYNPERLWALVSPSRAEGTGQIVDSEVGDVNCGLGAVTDAYHIGGPFPLPHHLPHLPQFPCLRDRDPISSVGSMNSRVRGLCRAGCSIQESCVGVWVLRQLWRR